MPAWLHRNLPCGYFSRRIEMSAASRPPLDRLSTASRPPLDLRRSDARRERVTWRVRQRPARLFRTGKPRWERMASGPNASRNPRDGSARPGRQSDMADNENCFGLISRYVTDGELTLSEPQRARVARRVTVSSRSLNRSVLGLRGESDVAVTQGGTLRRTAPGARRAVIVGSAALILGLPARLHPAGAHDVDNEWARRPAASRGARVEGRRPQARPSPGRHRAASGRSPPIG